MKPIFTILSLYSLLHSVIVYAEVGTVHTMREFSYRNEAEKNQAEEIALKMLRSAYDYFPDVENCYAGSVTSDQKRRVLKELNAIRRAHGLEEVKYDASKDRATAASALISAANGKLDHYPNNRMKCYSQDGYNGSSQSNLHLKGECRFGLGAFMCSVAGFIAKTLLIERYALKTVSKKRAARI